MPAIRSPCRSTSGSASASAFDAGMTFIHRTLSIKPQIGKTSMAKEVLYVPEEYLGCVIRILRAGIKAEKPKKEIKDPLLMWCKDEEDYLKRSFRKEYWP